MPGLIFSKVMRAGKATVFMVGLSVVLAVVLGVTTAALAAVPGDPFKLGQDLSADKLDNMDSSAFLPSEIYETSSVPTTIAKDSSDGVTATCESGDVAVSGSYKRTLNLEVTSERRVDDRFDKETGQINPSGWHVLVTNPNTTASGDTTSGEITVYFNCADRPPLHPEPARG
jgi:hypothetical protein